MPLANLASPCFRVRDSESSDQMIAEKRRVVHLLAVSTGRTAVSVCALCDCEWTDTWKTSVGEGEGQAGPGRTVGGWKGERGRERRNSHQIFIVDAREGNLWWRMSRTLFCLVESSFVLQFYRGRGFIPSGDPTWQYVPIHTITYMCLRLERLQIWPPRGPYLLTLLLQGRETFTKYNIILCGDFLKLKWDLWVRVGIVLRCHTTDLQE